jgi:tRNA threonylcarbamoyladenosine biosynthesis protein TsaE
MEPEARRLLAARSPAPEVTEAFGEELGRGLAPGSVLALVGELGAGKTCLVRGLARGMGLSSTVTSPTFTRMVEHEGPRPLFHFDAWREGSTDLLADSDEWLRGTGVAAIEWADRVEVFLPRPRLELRLAHLGPEARGLEAWLVRAAGDAPAPQRALEAALRDAVRDAGTAAGLEILDRS